ncbi:hypothetical protein [Marinilactibacillus piezotolerans]|uniref:hypothetical protein n=1 Tax=Marinilactibacillus piezotolerans TaxID=258723 RepID=UPI0009B15123|nr:hypothetical protein [Marinilactibacillus piezotolerans]
MKVNNRLFLSTLGIISTIAIIGLLFLSYIKLDEPLFFEHYYEQQVTVLSDGDLDSHGEEFELKYLTNAFEDKTVIHVEFPEEPDLAVQASEYPFGISPSSTPTPEETKGPYSVRTVYVQPLELFGAEQFDQTTLTQVKLFFSDNSSMTVDIGEVNFYTVSPDQLDTEPLNYFSSTSTSEGDTSHFYEVKSEVTLTGIHSEHLDKYADWINFKINDQPLETWIGKTFQSGETISGSSEMVENRSRNILDRFTEIKLRPELTLTDAEGQQHTSRTFEIEDREAFTFFNLLEYVKARGAL